MFLVWAFELRYSDLGVTVSLSQQLAHGSGNIKPEP